MNVNQLSGHEAPLSEYDKHRKLLAAALRDSRTAFSQGLFIAVQDRGCASWKVPLPFEQVKEWGRSLLLTAVDLLTAWFETRDPLYRELFAGWIHSRLLSALTQESVPSDYKPNKAVEFATVFWAHILESRVSHEAIQIFKADMAQIVLYLSKPPLKRLRVLFIGDCIQFEAITALAGPCAQVQVFIESTVILERVQPVVRNRIRTFSEEFDLVFFSPFSHRYLPEYEVLLKPPSALWSAARRANHVDRMLKEVGMTLTALATQFDCPIYVHNTAGTVQSFGKVSGLTKNLISRRSRKRSRRIINDGISRYVKDARHESQVRLLDEDALRNQQSELKLGQVYLNSHSFHPTRLGVELGRGLYFEAVYTRVFLANKKVVVCDLDNTLWEGIAGEGAITHHLERQAVLKALRQRGVLLSINSKNDPANVRWSGATLQPDDFVAPRINWNPKVTNMASIADELNLKTKDFVFIDDRPDELWRMQNAFPDILALDATQPATWNFLEHWQKTLPSDPEVDRTKLYHERLKREQFVSGLSQGAMPFEDEAAAMAALELSVKIEEVGRSGLKRAAELINRTNQFNLCGSRTTIQELEDGLGTRHRVITATAKDKFGSMGMVGVMQVDVTPGAVEIPIFVLSCRAFGFGIEYALLNSLKRFLPGDCSIIGHYQETQFNQPCRQFYPVTGMSWNGSSWTGRVAELASEPTWLKIENEMAVKAQGTYVTL